MHNCAHNKRQWRCPQVETNRNCLHDKRLGRVDSAGLTLPTIPVISLYVLTLQGGG